MNTTPSPAPAFYPLSQLLGLFPWACLHRFETVGQTNRKGNQSLGIPATLMPISLHHRDSQRGEEHLCCLVKDGVEPEAATRWQALHAFLWETVANDQGSF